jgi:hypothetical protein
MTRPGNPAFEVPTLPESKVDLLRVYHAFEILGGLGLIGALAFAIATAGGVSDGIGVFGGAILVGGALALVGGLVGFVFAIPRSRQSERAPQTEVADAGAERRLSDYAANTNLEQISDWLTKILVGVTLIQFNDLSQRFEATADALAPLLGAGPVARAGTLALMGYFMVWGFFMAYLLTRLWLPKALSRAEREEQHEALKEADLRALERRAYEYLYQPKPGGFTSAIQSIEGYLRRPRAVQSAWLCLYLAAAYGQKHAWDQQHGTPEEVEQARENAVRAVRQALELDPGTRPILQQLYRGTDPNEDDLVTLQGEETLEQLLGR